MSTPVTQPLDLDVQDVSTGDWDQLVADIMRGTADTTPQDPDTLTISGCCGCGRCSYTSACNCGC